VEPTTSVSLGCRIVAEFDETNILPDSEEEFVPLPVRPHDRFLLYSADAAATARTFWLKVIRRYTERVPGKRNHLRVRDVAAEADGRIIVEHGVEHRSSKAGSELDVSDKLCLTLFDTNESRSSSGEETRTTHTIPIPWTEILNVRFEITSPFAAAAM
jgi:hypothetical protein